MPKLGPSMEEGTVAKWHKNEGDAVSAGDPLVDIETDKTVVEIEAEAAGILRKVFARDGEKVPVGAVLGLVGSKEEPMPAPQPEEQRPASRPSEMPQGEPTDAAEEPGVRASPAARRRARELGLDLQRVSGTGPGGRIVTEDVERAARAAPFAPAGAPAGTVITLNSMRRAIAERMSESKHAIPHFYTGADVDMASVVAARAAWKAKEGEAAPSINDLLIWACARALKEHRAMNSGWTGDRITLFSEINIGVAMAVGNGLIVPVVRAADALSPREIAERTRLLAQKAADKKLTPFDTEGATFTITNLGMFEVDWFIPIINPPQCAILAAGQVADRVVPHAGSIAIRQGMTLILSADHRIVDGVAAGRLLRSIKTVLEGFSIAS